MAEKESFGLRGHVRYTCSYNQHLLETTCLWLPSSLNCVTLSTSKTSARVLVRLVGRTSSTYAATHCILYLNFICHPDKCSSTKRLSGPFSVVVRSWWWSSVVGGYSRYCPSVVVSPNILLPLVVIHLVVNPNILQS